MVATLAGVLMSSTAMAQTETQNWPPAFQPLPDFFGYLEPEKSLETFTLPPGYTIDLVASEPLLGDGIVMQWDYEGRIWVVETTFMLNLEELTSAEPSSSIVILSDTDGDGVMDTREVFAEGLVLPRSLLILEPGKVLVGESPNIWLLEDTDGDGKADTKTALTDGNYGAKGGSIEHNPNGMFWNIDNRIYNAYLDEVYTWNGEGFDTDRGISISQWGVAADDEGRLLRQGNSAAPSMSYVADAYYGRSSVFTRNRGNHEWIGGPSRAANQVWPIRPTPGVNRGYQEGVLDERLALAELTSAGGLAVHRGTALAPSDYGNVFVPEPAGNLVTMSSLHDTGSGIHIRKAYERGEFLTSTEERFRPVYVSGGPDGAFYVVDLYHGIVQDAVFLTNYLKDWIDEHDLGNNYGANGRIYRIAHESGEPSELINLANASTDELVALLEHDNGWYRDHAQRLMVVQKQTDAAPALKEMVQSSTNPVARLHALWTLDGLDAVETDLLVAALDDADRAIRTAAIRIAEPRLGEGDPAVTEAFLNIIGNTRNDWQVKYQLAASAGELADEHRLDAIVSILALYGEDFVAVDAALSGVQDKEIVALFDKLSEVEGANVGIANALTTVVAGIMRVGTAEDVAHVLEAIADSQAPAWQREASLLGTEIILAGAADPGLAPALPRAQIGPRNVGDLGDTHFTEFRDAVNALDAEQDATLAAQRAANAPARPQSALEEVDGIPMLVLSETPQSFLALADDPDFADRIESVAVLITWPGKEE